MFSSAVAFIAQPRLPSSSTFATVSKERHVSSMLMFSSPLDPRVKTLSSSFKCVMLGPR